MGVLLIFVIPVFAEMFNDFGAELPKPTQFLIGLSSFLKSYIVFLIIGIFGAAWLIKRFVSTPRGKIIQDNLITKLPVISELTRKVNLSRFCRTYAILMRSGVPILKTLDIVAPPRVTPLCSVPAKTFPNISAKGGKFLRWSRKTPTFPP